MTDFRSTVRRLRRVILAGVALTLFSTFLLADPAQAAPPTGNLKIQNLTSHLCLTPAGGSTANNALIVQYSCQMQNTRTYTATYSTVQHAYQLVNGNSDKCLSPAAGSVGLNAAIVQYTCDSDKSRYWTLVKRSGSWTLQNLKSELCLSPAGGGTGLNTVIVQYYCDGNQARNWYVFTPFTLTDFVGNGFCATIAGGSTMLNTVAVTYNCHSDTDASILWDLVATSTPNSVMLRNVGSSLCLSPAGGATAANTLVVQYYCDGQPSRLWQVGDHPYDTNRIVSNSSGLCLTGDGGGQNNALIIAPCIQGVLTNLWFVFKAF